VRVLLTGAGGFVGAYVARELLSRDHSVRGFDQRQAGIPGVEWIMGDLRDLSALESAVEGVDVVCHLAAIPAPRPREDWPAIIDVNIGGTYAVLEAMARHNVRRIVYASSACVIGGVCNWKYRPAPKYLPFDEDATVDADEPYSLSKAVNEQTARMFYHHGFLDAAIAMRLWNVRDAERQGLGILHHPTVVFATLHPLDAAQAFRLAVESTLEGCHAFSVSSRWRYNADGSRESEEQTHAIIEAAFPKGIELREGFPSTWGSAGSSRRLMRVLGYEPRF